MRRGFQQRSGACRRRRVSAAGRRGQRGDRSAGSAARRRSPSGGAPGAGTRAGDGRQPCSPAPVAQRGIVAEQRRGVADAAGAANSAATGAVSTMRPAYITATRSQISATTPRSCVMSSTRHAELAAAGRRSRSRICACTVTSSAVVGSSAMSRLGLAGERHRDHHALAHAAGELVRIVVERARRDRECRPASSSSTARPRASRASGAAMQRAAPRRSARRR